jgi:uncharacterized protein (DUF1697 family)
MKTFVSVLRGINVSGHKKIPMAELKALYEELNFKHITTYIQSGNVIFEGNDSKNLPAQIEKKLLEKYGFKVPVIIRTANELVSLIESNPFLKDKSTDTSKLHVTFLEKPPQQADADKINKAEYEPDRFIISKQEVYLYCPGGYGNTKLTNTFFESKLKVTATTRNWRTVNELLKIIQSGYTV